MPVLLALPAESEPVRLLEQREPDCEKTEGVAVEGDLAVGDEEAAIADEKQEAQSEHTPVQSEVKPEPTTVGEAEPKPSETAQPPEPKPFEPTEP